MYIEVNFEQVSIFLQSTSEPICKTSFVVDFELLQMNFEVVHDTDSISCIDWFKN